MRDGDRVVILVNDYDHGSTYVFKGETGTVVGESNNGIVNVRLDSGYGGDDHDPVWPFDLLEVAVLV